MPAALSIWKSRAPDGRKISGPESAGSGRPLPAGWASWRAILQPLDELLNRIRWDPEFAKGTFALGYVDRVAGREQVVPLPALAFDPARPGTFIVKDQDGNVRHVPLHRVRTVYKDGAVIWRRP